jgi:hypothetical protein
MIILVMTRWKIIVDLCVRPFRTSGEAAELVIDVLMLACGVRGRGRKEKMV